MRISLDTSLVGLMRSGGTAPASLYNFLFTSTSLNAAFSFSRASSATDIIDGTLTVFTTDQPRISVANGLLIEEAGTNLVGNGIGSMAGGAVTSGQTDPLGGTSAYKYVANTTTGAHAAQATFAISPVGSTAHTISCFVKYVNVQFVQLLMPGGHGATNCYANFDIVNGTVTAQGAGSLGAQITPLSGGWYRIAMTYTTVASPTSNAPIIIAALQTGTNLRYPSFTGAGTEEFWVFGPQVEQRPFLTSYIVTTSGAASRAADVCTAALANLDTVRYIFAEFRRITGIDASSGFEHRPVQLDDGSASNRHLIGIVASSQNITALTSAGGATQANPTLAGSGITLYKAAYRANMNDFRQATNGVLSAADTSGALPSGLTTLRIGKNVSATGFMNGYVRRVVLDTAVKSDAELQAVTA